MITSKLIDDIFKAIRGRFTVDEIERLIITDPAGLIRFITEYTVDEFSAALIPQIESVIIAEGTPAIVTEILPDGAVTSPWSFSISQPFTAQYIREFVGNDIREITETTVTAVRQTVERGQQQGRNPRNIAVDFRDNIGLTARMEQAVANYRAGLESLSPEVLQRALRDKRFDSTIRNAIGSGAGLTEQQIDRYVKRYRERAIKSRSETIARTEQLTAVTVGQRQSLLQARDQGKLSPRLRRFWEYTHDSRTRHWHSDIPTLNPDGVAIDEQYLTQPPGRTEYVTAPRDPMISGANRINCRCRERYELV